MIFNKYKNIDVSFALKYSEIHQSYYNTEYMKNYMDNVFGKINIPKMTEEDYVKIQNFVDQLSKIRSLV